MCPQLGGGRPNAGEDVLTVVEHQRGRAAREVRVVRP